MAFSLVGSGFLLAQLGPWEMLPCSAGGSVREACDNLVIMEAQRKASFSPIQLDYCILCLVLHYEDSSHNALTGKKPSPRRAMTLAGGFKRVSQLFLNVFCPSR
ncbi:hypothetical protein X797_003545 [Metarhizium robertsii]|uniref:Secreted protein n=1 Tax=Metarhizium robertsii TaxID=568076 RepID=A0A0A1V286_9HYPO|nr:hypothetical protein X797_003545 [Metarhizium robertsii]